MSGVLLIDIPRLNLGKWLEDFIDWLTDNFEAIFDGIDSAGDAINGAITSALQWPDPVIMAVIFAVIGFLASGWKLGLGTLVGMIFIISLDQWDLAMETLSLVTLATAIALLIAIPVGIWAARSRGASAVVRPILDFMQTMPAMVWLVPVVTIFHSGPTGAVLATIVFALPPGVRLTELGIRNVDAEVVEAANAFGATPRQTLFGVQLPLAMPSIMAGVNQVIMLSLSMAVIAGFVGAGGLGQAVIESLGTLDVALGFEAGLAVVVLAIYLDRVTASIGQGSGGGIASLRRRRQESRAASSTSEDDEPTIEANRDRRAAGAI